MFYSFSWPGKFIAERQELLMMVGIGFSYDEKRNEIETEKRGFSSGQTEVLNFVQNLNQPVNLNFLDNDIALKVLELHYKFWKERLSHA